MVSLFKIPIFVGTTSFSSESAVVDRKMSTYYIPRQPIVWLKKGLSTVFAAKRSNLENLNWRLNSGKEHNLFKATVFVQLSI